MTNFIVDILIGSKNNGVECIECGKLDPIYHCKYCGKPYCEDCMNEHLDDEHSDKIWRGLQPRA